MPVSSMWDSVLLRTRMDPGIDLNMISSVLTIAKTKQPSNFFFFLIFLELNTAVRLFHDCIRRQRCNSSEYIICTLSTQLVHKNCQHIAFEILSILQTLLVHHLLFYKCLLLNGLLSCTMCRGGMDRH